MLNTESMIEDDDGVIARERGHVIGEILLGAAKAVHEDEARARPRHVDRQPHSVARRDPHPHMLTRNPPVAPHIVRPVVS